MLFNEKLDFLMKLTDTTNSRLAHTASLDNSYVSRLRSGARRPARKADYITIFAEYFAKHITHEYQKAALFKAAGVKATTLPYTERGLSEFINSWLSGEAEKLTETNAIENFVSGLSFSSNKQSPLIHSKLEKARDGLKINNEVFFGNNGKRDAVAKFLTLVLAQKNPSTLLLYSEEDMLWLTEDPEFVAEWKLLMSQIIAKGNKIKIIHTVSRSLDEMLSSITQWLPLYMSGAIESYYYPKHRDGLFKRTLFLAPDTAAVVSNAIGASSKNTANYLFTDKSILFSLTDEFQAYQSLCHPLIHIFTRDNYEKFLDVLSEFENEHGDSIIKTTGLSSITMPVKLIFKISARTQHPDSKQIIACQRTRTVSFEEKLNENKFTEIIYLPEIEEITSEKVPVQISDFFCAEKIFYTTHEYLLHLQNIIRLLETYPNYHVFIDTKKQIEPLIIYTKEETGVIIAKNHSSPVIFAINENNMTSAFWSYLSNMINKFSKGMRSKTNVLKQLKNITNSLILNMEK